MPQQVTAINPTDPYGRAWESIISLNAEKRPGQCVPAVMISSARHQIMAPDFSATHDLYGVVSNIDEIRIVPVAVINVYLFVIAALIPCIPVVIAAIPFNVLMKAVMKLV